jgi:hypothetical protein
VPILKQASVELRKRLLELFPVAALRESFSAVGSKGEIAAAVAKSTDDATLLNVAEFVDSRMTIGKQHIYVFAHDGHFTFPEDFGGAERVVLKADHALYITRRKYQVVFTRERFD